MTAAQTARTHLPDAGLIVRPADHVVFVEEPDWFAATVAEFVATPAALLAQLRAQQPDVALTASERRLILPLRHPGRLNPRMAAAASVGLLVLFPQVCTPARITGANEITPQRIVSPNYDPRPIDVRFLVIHYTAVESGAHAGDFYQPAREAAAHLVLDVDGALYECVSCWEKRGATRLAHWQHRWHDGATQWEALNNWSMGQSNRELQRQHLPPSPMLSTRRWEKSSPPPARLSRHLTTPTPCSATNRSPVSTARPTPAGSSTGRASLRCAVPTSRRRCGRRSARPPPAAMPWRAWLRLPPPGVQAANTFWERVSLLSRDGSGAAVIVPQRPPTARPHHVH